MRVCSLAAALRTAFGRSTSGGAPAAPAPLGASGTSRRPPGRRLSARPSARRAAVLPNPASLAGDDSDAPAARYTPPQHLKYFQASRRRALGKVFPSLEAPPALASKVFPSLPQKGARESISKPPPASKVLPSLPQKGVRECVSKPPPGQHRKCFQASPH